MGIWGILYLRNTYALSIQRPYPCTPMVIYINDKYSRSLLGPILNMGTRKKFKASALALMTMRKFKALATTLMTARKFQALASAPFSPSVP